MLKLNTDSYLELLSIETFIKSIQILITSSQPIPYFIFPYASVF